MIDFSHAAPGSSPKPPHVNGHAAHAVPPAEPPADELPGDIADEELPRGPLKFDLWPRPEALVARMGNRGPRFKTGFESIDKGWRGGAMMGKRFGILGAPGAGKTTMATQLARHFAMSGVPTVYVANDEPREDILIRFGQMFGLDRNKLEKGTDDVKEALAAYLAALMVWILDPDEDEGFEVPKVFEAAREKFPDGPLVVVLDSLQTLAQAIPDSVADGMRAKVDLVLKQIKHAARALKIFVILLSEMNRSAYRMKGESLVDDLAAGKESGGIEYACDAMCVIRNIPDSDGLVSVAWPKSRLGKVPTFAMQKNDATATFSECPMPEAVAGPAPARRGGPRPETLGKIKKAIVALLTERGELPKAEILDTVSGKSDNIRDAIDELLEAGILQERIGDKSSKHYSVSLAAHMAAQTDADLEGVGL